MNPDGSLWLRAIPALFVLIWSTGYIVARIAAEHGAPPLFFLCTRYAGVIVLMALLTLRTRAKWPTPRQTLHLAIAGLGIHAIYLAGVWIAIRQGMPAGMSALIVNLQPALTAMLGFLVHERVNGRQWTGIALGFAGVTMVVWHKLWSAELGLGPVLLCLVALLGITLGTLHQKRHVAAVDPRSGQVVQFVVSLAATLPVAIAVENWSDMHWSAPVIGVLLWSVLVLSGVGISLMFLMLRHGRITSVTGVFYLVPLVTALMAWSMFGEAMTGLGVTGMLVTLIGVSLVVRPIPR